MRKWNKNCENKRKREGMIKKKEELDKILDSDEKWEKYLKGKRYDIRTDKKN